MCDPGNITGNSNRRSIPRKTVWTSHWGECIICGMHLAAKSLCSHIETQHNTYRSFILNQELTVVCEAPPVPISVRYRHVWALQALNKLFSNFFNAIPRTWCAAQWRGNLKKAQGVWARIYRIISAKQKMHPPMCAAYSTKQTCN